MKKRESNLTEAQRREADPVKARDQDRIEDEDESGTQRDVIPAPEVDPGQEGLIGEPSAEQKEQAPNPTPRSATQSNVPADQVAFEADEVKLPDHTFVGPVVTGHKPQPIGPREMESAEAATPTNEDTRDPYVRDKNDDGIVGDRKR